VTDGDSVTNLSPSSRLTGDEQKNPKLSLEKFICNVVDDELHREIEVEGIGIALKAVWCGDCGSSGSGGHWRLSSLRLTSILTAETVLQLSGRDRSV
jgi:hypothetical protein